MKNEALLQQLLLVTSAGLKIIGRYALDLVIKKLAISGIHFYDLQKKKLYRPERLSQLPITNVKLALAGQY